MNTVEEEPRLDENNLISLYYVIIKRITVKGISMSVSRLQSADSGSEHYHDTKESRT